MKVSSVQIEFEFYGLFIYSSREINTEIPALQQNLSPKRIIGGSEAIASLRKMTICFQ